MTLSGLLEARGLDEQGGVRVRDDLERAASLLQGIVGRYEAFRDRILADTERRNGRRRNLDELHDRIEELRNRLARIRELLAQ